MNIEPVDLVLRGALATEGAGEQPPNTNAGPYPERVLKRVGAKKGDPWCCAQVCDWMADALKEKCPIPMTASCQELFDWAAKKGLIHTTPEVGDIFMVWHPELGRFAHTGFVVSLPNVVICGNTTSPGGSADPALAREGWCVAKKPWPFHPADRFIRWRGLVAE